MLEGVTTATCLACWVIEHLEGGVLVAVRELVQVQAVHALVDLVRDIPVLSGLTDLIEIDVHHHIADVLGYSIPFYLTIKPIVAEHTHGRLRELNNPPATVLVIDYEE